MHLSYKCASEFAPEGQLRLQLAPFLRTSRREGSASSQRHYKIPIYGFKTRRERALKAAIRGRYEDNRRVDFSSLYCHTSHTPLMYR